MYLERLISKVFLIQSLKKQLALLLNIHPSESEENQSRLEREIYNIQAQILQLNKTNKKFIKIKIEQFESSINL